MPDENKPTYEVKIPFKNNDTGQWEYYPICSPATGTTKGTVSLSDIYDDSASNLDIASGTAFTPKGANDLYKNVLSKVNEDSQGVAGPVEFNNAVYFWKTAEFGKGSDDKDSLVHFRKPFTLKIGLRNVADALKAIGTIEENDIPVTVNIDSMALPAGNLIGTVPLKCIPQGAIEELHKYNSLQAAIDAYKEVAESTDENKVYPFEIGDTILDISTTPNVMYIAVGPNLAVEDGYIEYASGTAMRLGTSNLGSKSQPIYLVGGQPFVCTNLVPMSDNDIDAAFTKIFG